MKRQATHTRSILKFSTNREGIRLPEGKADFTRTCAGCDAVIQEQWPRGKTGYRCGEPGPCKGYMVGIGRFNPYIPAWCPKAARSRDGPGTD